LKADKAGDVDGRSAAVISFLPGNLITALKDEAIGKLPINTQLSAYGNVATPEAGPKWQLRLQIQFLFPGNGKCC
jgi:hypothetical protein